MTNEIHPLTAPSPKAALGYDGTDFIVLSVDANGCLQVNAISPSEVRLYGWDTLAGEWDKVATDPAGHLYVHWSPGDTVLSQIQGHNGVNWESLISDGSGRQIVRGEDQLVSVRSIVEEQLSDTNVGAGTNQIDGTIVPAGEYWHITQIAFMYRPNVPLRLQFLAIGLAGGIVVHNIESPNASQWYPLVCNIWLQSGDNMCLRVDGATAGDDIYGRYAGLKMTVEA